MFLGFESKVIQANGINIHCRVGGEGEALRASVALLFRVIQHAQQLVQRGVDLGQVLLRDIVRCHQSVEVLAIATRGPEEV